MGSARTYQGVYSDFRPGLMWCDGLQAWRGRVPRESNTPIIVVSHWLGLSARFVTWMDFIRKAFLRLRFSYLGRC